MNSEDRLLIRATMEGYVAALLDSSSNPYAYITGEAWAWQHGYTQGSPVKTLVTTGEPPMPFPGYDRKAASL